MLITTSLNAQKHTGSSCAVKNGGSCPLPGSKGPQDQVSLGQETDWDPTQSFATLKEKKADGRVVLEGVRWGLNEVGAPAEWTGRFATTEIDPSKVKDVYVGLVPFMKDKLAHSILVFEFDESSPIKNENGETDNRLVLSVDARTKKGEPWSIKKGLKREYPLVYQMDSFGARVQRGNRQLGDRLVMHKLELDSDEKKRLIDRTLQEAVSPHENYHTIDNSCWTNVIDLLNDVTDGEQRIRKNSIASFGLTHRIGVIDPILGGSLLESSGLLAGEPGIVIQPDSQLHAEKRVSEKTNAFLQSMSNSALWTPACTVAGAAGLGALGYAIGGAIPGVLGGLLGGSLANIASREARVRNNVTFLNPEPFYPKVGVRPQG